ncbi:unnamed protein product [Phytomonas sp. EM1]|nr:unnamed protein product [Phytomonas sp. EM1]|eukprot:CCW64652.1 unnamed protein product [Phytomonas sp. isolate EM1]
MEMHVIVYKVNRLIVSTHSSHSGCVPWSFEFGLIFASLFFSSAGKVQLHTREGSTKRRGKRARADHHIYCRGRISSKESYDSLGGEIRRRVFYLLLSSRNRHLATQIAQREFRKKGIAKSFP